MHTVAFLTQKGGSGKSTLALHIAVAAQQKGERVAIFDTDPQGSAVAWGAQRQTETPVVYPMAAPALPRALRQARTEAISLSIVDTAPHAAPAASSVARSVKLVVIPCRPTAFDLAAIPGVVDIVRAAKAKGVFVLSACPTRAPEVGEAREVLKAYGMAVAPYTIGDRRAFSRAIATGRAVTEIEGQGKAAEEIGRLWSWLKKQLQ